MCQTEVTLGRRRATHVSNTLVVSCFQALESFCVAPGLSISAWRGDVILPPSWLEETVGIFSKFAKTYRVYDSNAYREAVSARHHSKPKLA